MLLQNTIALQYAGIFTNYNNSTWPQDLVYYNPLPNWQINDFFLIRNQAGLVGFANAPYVDDGTTKQTASIAILPLVPTADLSDIQDSVFTVQNAAIPASLWSFRGWLDGQEAPATNDPDQPLAWLGGTGFCDPTAADPCELWWGIGELDRSPTFRSSSRITPIDDLFGPPTGAAP